MNILYISIDESGTFSSSEEYFVFGGYAILGTEQYQGKMRKYQRVESKITDSKEVKGSEIEAYEKINLINVMKGATSFAIAIKNENLSIKCNNDNLSKALIKDDLLKDIILEVISTFELDQIDKIVIEVDEQNLKFGIRQNLYTALYRVLISGYYSRNQFVKGMAKDGLLLEVSYLDSKGNIGIRAADVLVNHIYQKLNNNQDVYSILKIFKLL